MIRRTAAGLGILAAISITALAVPAVAHAAQGVLFVNRQAYADPVGCINFQQPYDSQGIANYTDQTVTVYAGLDCQGPITTVIESNQGQEVFGSSVLVP
jgi:hypothetical protein